MKTVEVTIYYRGGSNKQLFIIETGDSLTDIVDEFCHKNGIGQSFGYSFEVKYITDPIVIKEAITNYLKFLGEENQALQKQIEKLFAYSKQLKK